MDPLVSETVTNSQASADQKSPAIWGLTATLLWSVLIAVVSLVAGGAGMVLYVIWLSGSDPAVADAVIDEVRFDLTFYSLPNLAVLLVTVPLIIGIVKLKRGSNVNNYLGLKLPPLKEALRWSLIALCFFLLVQAVGFIWPSLPSEYMGKAYYGSAAPRWLYWLSTIIAAPIHEEFFFRGFLFKGLAASRLRWSGAVLITAVLWAGAHQHHWFRMLTIFGAGLILGIARAKTNSTLLTIWLHSLVNGALAAQVAFMQLLK